MKIIPNLIISLCCIIDTCSQNCSAKEVSAKCTKYVLHVLFSLQAYDLVELKEVACKIHRLGAHWSKTRQTNFARHACREYVIHKSLIHPGIVRLFDVFDIDQYTFCTILEYCTAGDLEEYLRQKQSLPQRETRFIIKQIVEVHFF